MATRITIARDGGKTPFSAPADLQQQDMVFWHNDDSQPHFPVPGAGSLSVAPGKDSAAFPVMPTPALPLTIDYVCALHPNESGKMVIGGSATPAPVVGIQRTIAIGRGGTFAEINVQQPDSVVWRNGDTREHWPVPNCTGLRVAPGASSNALQPAPNPNAPLTILYGCAIEGHENEQGTINIFNAFVAVAPPVQLSAAAPSAPIATGGMSPYAFRPDPRYQQALVLSETTPAGSSTGVTIGILPGVTIPAGTINYALYVVDAMETLIQQQIEITFS